MGNRVTELLGIEKPVMLGAMTVICNADLAAAVCNAGGLGMLGINCAVTEIEPDPVKNGENLRAEIKKLRSMTDKPFAVAYVPPAPGMDPADKAHDFSAPYKRIMIEEKVAAVAMVSEFWYDELEQEFADFHAAGVKVMYREICPTVETCIKAAKAGADIIIVTGTEGGGHASEYNMSLLSILPQVTDAIKDVPIVAAGGIVGEKGARAAAVMGAEAAYCGTAFMVASEGRMHPNYKKAIIDARSEDVLMWRATIGRMVTINNFNGRVCDAMARGGASKADLFATYSGANFFRSMLEGDVENGCVSVSTAVGAITEERPAKAIVDDIAKGFDF